MPRGKKKEVLIEDHTDLGQVLAAVQGLGKGLESLAGRLDGLEAKVKEQDKKVPRFARLDQELGASPPGSTVGGITKKGDRAQGGKDLPVTSDGMRIVGYKPEFQEGDHVRINPESDLAHTLRTNKKDPDALLGTIVGTHFYSEARGQMKYRVHFPGETRGFRGDGYWEGDLVSC